MVMPNQTDLTTTAVDIQAAGAAVLVSVGGIVSHSAGDS